MGMGTQSIEIVKSMFWKEYPERDREYVRWYPPSIKKIDQRSIWNKREIGFYIHIPFCKVVCKYCPFNKYTWEPNKVRDYLERLKKEIEMYGKLPYIQDSTIIAGYFGGGTPTSLTTDQLFELIACCQENFDIASDAEICTEANPETVDEIKLKTLRDSGINRISFGVQSFNNRFLKIMGRGHRAEVALSAIKMARDMKFENIGIDLIYYIPTQTLPDWEKELNQAISLGVDHISTFNLSISPNTPLYQEQTNGKIPFQQGEQIEIEMYNKAIEMLSEAGYHQYTLLDFALPGKECLHHDINWQAPQREYIGLGAGAFSYINGHIYCNSSPLNAYSQAIDNGNLPISFGKKLTIEEKMSRYFILGVKFLEISKSKFREQFGIKADDVFGDIFQKLEKLGLITNNDEMIAITQKGKLYADNISKMFYTKENIGIPQPRGVDLQKGKGISVGPWMQ